jgi:hypothetical protein
MKITVDEFRKAYPNAQIKDVTPDAIPLVPLDTIWPMKKQAKTFVQPGIAYHKTGVLTIMVAVETPTELHKGKHWSARHKRTGEQWKAVREAVGVFVEMMTPFMVAYRDDRALRVTFTRLGRKCDRSNIPSACKGLEDALSYLLGANDGDPRWQPRFEQEASKEIGVRIELEIA